jgi:hypothetical protein
MAAAAAELRRLASDVAASVRTMIFGIVQTAAFIFEKLTAW